MSASSCGSRSSTTRVAIVTDEQYQRLQRCARASRADRSGLILQGAILAIGEAALRPGEIFALRHDDIDFAAGVLHVRRQVDLHTGVVKRRPLTGRSSP